MVKGISTFIKEGGWLILLAGILYLGGWHTEVIGFLQRGILYTGLFNPDAAESQTQPLPDVQSLLLYDEQGNTLHGSQLSGELVLLNVWATWCPPCIAEMPGLHRLYQDLGAGEVRFLMVTVDKDFEKAIAFRDKKGYSFPIYRLGHLPAELQSRSIPATYVIDPDGRLRFRHEGMAEYDTAEFRKMLQQWQGTAGRAASL